MKTFIKLQKKNRDDIFVEVPVDHRGKVIRDKKGFVHFRHANGGGRTISIDLLFDNYREEGYELSRHTQST